MDMNSRRDLFDYDGAYLDPGWIFTDGVDPEQPEPALTGAIEAFAREQGLTVASATSLDGREVVITHGSGVFVRAAGVIGRDGYDERQRERDRRDAARVCNLVICELALNSVVTRPFTPEDMCGSSRDGETVSIWVAGGLKQVRSWATQAVLEGGESVGVAHWPAADVGLLDRSIEAPRARQLADVSDVLPDFIASALISRVWDRPAETVLFSWIVAEQLVNRAWDSYVEEVHLDTSHKDRLTDHRSYTAAVQIDTLQAHDVLSAEASSALHRARKRRNALAHSATLHDDAVEEGIRAMGHALHELGEIELDPATLASIS
jgi:hypothetical protein